MTPDFAASESMVGRAREALERERVRIAGLCADAEVELTGTSSVGGMLTSGDIDLHVRVPEARFPAVVDALRGTYDVVLPDIWSATLATFTVRGDPSVGVAVTPIGSTHDRRFRRSWQRLRNDPIAAERYNALKRAHAGRDAGTYAAAKSAFFDEMAGDV